jgi:hypothetical protein
MLGLLPFFFAKTAADCSGSFLGLKPWFEYLKLDDSCNIKDINIFPGSNGQASDVPLILLAIVDDLLRIAALVAIAFVIVGAIQFVTSQGDPEGAANAQSTIVNALIGLSIAIVSVAFVSFLGHKLGS